MKALQRSCTTLAMVVGLGWSTVAHAAPPDSPAGGEAGAASATPSSQADATEEPKDLDATEFSVGAGINGSSGNSRNLTSSANLDSRVRRGDHQFTAKALHLGGSAAAASTRALVPNLSKQLVRARYDYMLPRNFVLFTQVQWRRDLFQGLRTRVNVDPGVGFYALDTEDFRLLFQAGYDLQYDLRTRWLTYEANDDGKIILDPDGLPNPIMPEEVVLHQARLFFGTENQILDRAKINGSIEYIQALTDQRRFLINAEASLSAHITRGFSMGMTFLLQHEHTPLPRVFPTDTTTTFNLMYALDDERIAENKARRAARRERDANKAGAPAN